MIYSFCFNVEPVSKGRPRFSRARKQAFTPPKTRHFENEIAILAKVQLQGAEPLNGELVMNVSFEFKEPKKTSLPAPKHDIDNLLKSLADSLNGIAYHDDSQISVVIAHKFWSTENRITVWLSNELEGGEENESNNKKENCEKKGRKKEDS